MTDIETLREFIQTHQSASGFYAGEKQIIEPPEALTALDSLQARIAELENWQKSEAALALRERNAALAELDSLHAHIAELEKEISAWREGGVLIENVRIQANRAEKAEAERDALRALNERAKEVLGPFKLFLDANEQVWADDDTIAVSTGEGRTREAWLTFGHIRLARAVLAELSADAPAQQTQISDGAIDAALDAWYPGEDWRSIIIDHKKQREEMRAAITAANEWGK